MCQEITHVYLGKVGYFFWSCKGGRSDEGQEWPCSNEGLHFVSPFFAVMSSFQDFLVLPWKFISFILGFQLKLDLTLMPYFGEGLHFVSPFFAVMSFFQNFWVLPWKIHFVYFRFPTEVGCYINFVVFKICQILFRTS